MVGFITGRRGTGLIALLLVAQTGILWLSMDAGAYSAVSVFCTGPADSRIGFLFGLLHLLLLGLLLTGLLSLRIARLRLPYIGVLTAALVLLPVQATLVSNGSLSCDGP